MVSVMNGGALWSWRPNPRGPLRVAMILTLALLVSSCQEEGEPTIYALGNGSYTASNVVVIDGCDAGLSEESVVESVSLLATEDEVTIDFGDGTILAFARDGNTFVREETGQVPDLPCSSLNVRRGLTGTMTGDDAFELLEAINQWRNAPLDASCDVSCLTTVYIEFAR